jgi:hypothetical protein
VRPFVRRAMHVAVAESRYIHVPRRVWGLIRASERAVEFITEHGTDASEMEMDKLKRESRLAWEMAMECRKCGPGKMGEEARRMRGAADFSLRRVEDGIGEPPEQETSAARRELLRDVGSFLSHRAGEKGQSELPNWRRFGVPAGFFTDKENRVEAVRWLVGKLGKEPQEISYMDFKENGIVGVFNHCGNSIWKALREAGYGMEPWEMRTLPKGFFMKKENRARATRWLVEKLGADIRNIIYSDFEENGIARVLDFHGKHPHGALLEAGYEVEPWEMARVPKNFYKSRENRAKATRWLVEKIGKPASEIKSADFEANGLGRVLQCCGKSPFLALKEAGLVKEPFEMGRVPRTYYRERKNRIASVKRLVELVGKEAREITFPDFAAHGMAGLVQGYYHSSPFEALFDAGLVGRKDEAYMRSLFRKGKR